MTRVGFVMLAHTAPHRAVQVARHWAAQGAPLVIHVDADADACDRDMRAGLADLPGVSFCPRQRSSWGSWSLVAAALSGAGQMLDRHPEVDRIFLASGSCLPLRPLDELRAYLAAHPDTDFIESVVTSEAAWAQGGLEGERFRLHFPFSWRQQRWLFDRYVALQRRYPWLVRRRIPPGVTPHLGSQWWCLTRETLHRILTDPRRDEIDRYFRGVWIPDESYFQTMARRHARTIESRSLTLTKFDGTGLPNIFYDDHIDLLRRSEVFVVRKVWPEANRLYDSFLAPDPSPSGRTRLLAPDPARIDRIFNQAIERRKRGRPGLYMQTRFPRQGNETNATPQPYVVFQGFSDLLPGFADWLSRRHVGRVHGHLFAEKGAEFAAPATTHFDGAISASAELRDYNPCAFLTSLLWNRRGERQVFQMSVRDTVPEVLYWFLATDPKATIHVITGAWAVPLFLSGKPVPSLWREAARLQRIQSGQMKIIESAWTRARVRVWTLAEFLRQPEATLHALVRELQGSEILSPAPIPSLPDLAGFGRFLQMLRNQGLRPERIGEFAEHEVFDEAFSTIGPQTPLAERGSS